MNYDCHLICDICFSFILVNNIYSFTTRLDRLFVLLEAGAGPATRRAAARQLGEVQKAHPEELHRLLGRLMTHLRSPAWETRTAAAQVWNNCIFFIVSLWYNTWRTKNYVSLYIYSVCVQIIKNIYLLHTLCDECVWEEDFFQISFSFHGHTKFFLY